MSREMPAPVAAPSPEAPAAREVEPGVVLIDHGYRGLPGVIASYLLVSPAELTLVEAGPQSTMETLLAGIRAAGHDPGDITRILLTHIHLDHAGASGSLLRLLPRARLFVHPAGAPHLLDPSRLLASAERIYGDMMKPLWGEVLPVPADRLTVLRDGELVETAAGRPLRALHTAGHAVHHIAFHDESGGAVFTGDVAGIRLEGVRYVRPPTPPPELDLDAWRESIARLRAARPRRLYLTHFGGCDDVEWHLDELLARLFLWAGRIGAQLEAGVDADTITETLRRVENAALASTGAERERLRQYEEAGAYRMSVDGFVRYFRKRAERREAERREAERRDTARPV